MNKLFPVIFVVILFSAVFAAYISPFSSTYLSPSYENQLRPYASVQEEDESTPKPKTRASDYFSLENDVQNLLPSVSEATPEAFEPINLACKSNENCGNLAHAHKYKTPPITGASELTVKTKPSETGTAEVYISNGELWHKITEIKITNTESWNTDTIVTTQKYNEILINMPSKKAETEVEIKPMSTETRSSTRAVVGWETCENNVGYSSNPKEKHCKGHTDCCAWYQKYHVHDMGSTINSAVNIYVDIKTGLGNGCTSNTEVYTSTDKTNWNKVGQFSTTSKDMDSKPGYPQAWMTHTQTFKNYNTNFRYIKVQNNHCYNDWSYVTVSNSVSNQNPVAALSIPTTAKTNTPITFNAGSSYDPDGTIGTYIYEFGDFQKTSTSSSSTTHSYANTGTYTVSLIVKDGEGAQDKLTKTITITQNTNTKPVVNIIHPKNNGKYSWTGLNFTVTDDTDTTVSCQHRVDGGTWTTAYNVNTGTQKDVNIGVLTEASHTIQVNCTDSGSLIGSDYNVFTIDKTAPSVSIDYPEHDWYTNSTSVTLEYSTSNTDVYNYLVSLNQTQWYSTNSKQYTFKGLLDNTNYSYYVYANDTAGNTGSIVHVNATNDLTAPDANITLPVNGTTVYTANVGVYYTSTHNDTNHSIISFDNGATCPTPYTLEWTDGGGAKWCADPNGSPSAFKNLGDGWHTLRVRHVDHANNIGAENNVTVFVDGNRPTLSIVGPQDDSVFAVNSVEMNMTTTHADVTKIEYSKDGSNWYNTGITSFPTNTNMTYTFTNLPKGVYEIYVRAFDNEGAGDAANVTVNISVGADLQPVVTIDSPVEDKYYKTVSELKFTVADDVNSTTMNCKYQLDSGGWTQTTATNGTQKTVSINPSGDGAHYVEVDCYDGSNWAEYPGNTTFYLDTTAPTISIHTANDTMDNEIYFQYSGSDAGSGVNYYRVSLNTTGWINTTYLYHTFNGVDNDYWLYAYAVDEAGNEGDYKIINISIDTTKPGITITAPLNNSVSIGSSWESLNYNTAAGDLDYYEVKEDGGNWINKGTTTFHWFNLNDGERKMYARAVDKYGNVGDYKFINMTIDANGPDAKFQSPANGTSYTTDDVKIFFYSNDTSIQYFQYSIDGGTNWHDTGACTSGPCTNDTTYNITINNVPEGLTKIQIRGNDSSGNVGASEHRWVYVDSIYTNLQVSVTAPSSVITSTPFTVSVWVSNNNEENITSGQVLGNLTLPTGCSGTDGSWSGLGTIPGRTSKSVSWSVTCQTGTYVLWGWMNYTTQNKQKNASFNLGTVQSMSLPPEENSLENVIKSISKLLRPTPEKAYEPPKIEVKEPDVIKF